MPIAPLPPCLVSTCPNRRPCADHDRALARERDKRWYHLARWRHPEYGLRSRTLHRDPLCVACRMVGRLVASTEVDHVIPHRGDPVLFWNIENTQGLCATCHTAKSNRGE